MWYAFQHENHQYLRKEGEGDAIRLLCHPTQFVFIQRHLHKAPLEVCSMNHMTPPDMESPERALEAMTRVQAAP